MYLHVAKPKVPDSDVVDAISLARAVPFEIISALARLFWWEKGSFLSPEQIDYIFDTVVPARLRRVVLKIRKIPTEMGTFVREMEERLAKEPVSRKSYFHISVDGWLVVFYCGNRNRRGENETR